MNHYLHGYTTRMEESADYDLVILAFLKVTEASRLSNSEQKKNNISTPYQCHMAIQDVKFWPKQASLSPISSNTYLIQLKLGTLYLYYWDKQKT